MRSRHDPSAPESLAGTLLLAHPGLRDPNFHRAVVLLSAHDAEGAMGVVINRPQGRTLGELDPAFAAGELAGVPVFTGGPVEPEHLLLCGWKLHPGQLARFTLHFGVEPAQAARLVGEEGMVVRAFKGYAGWTSGQLEQELSQGAWTAEIIPDNFMALGEDEALWRGLLATYRHIWRVWADEPPEPGRN
jgi:putative transcriptional regulator